MLHSQCPELADVSDHIVVAASEDLALPVVDVERLPFLVPGRPVSQRDARRVAPGLAGDLVQPRDRFPIPPPARGRCVGGVGALTLVV